MFSHDCDFDPSYGYSQADLQEVGLPPEPADFCAFWRVTYAETLAQPLNLVRTSMPSPNPCYHLERIAFDTWGSYRIGAWLATPSDGDIHRAVVVGHGYGGREGPDLGLPVEDAAAIFPCAPGFNLSARPDIPDNSQNHVIFGIESREDYIIRPSVAMVWSAASVLTTLYPGIAGHLGYIGGSFGGGIGALALPWDERFVRAHLGVPTFGHHPIRLQCPCVGSGEAVRAAHREHPEIAEVLAYYDAAVAASYIAIPTLVSPALFDPAVPPPGQFAVANAIRDRHVFVLSAGHFEYAEQTAEEQSLRAAQEGWFLEM